MKLSWLDYIKLLVRGRGAVQEAIAQGKLVKNVHATNSWKSTEFWGAVLTGLGAILAQLNGVIPEPVGALIASASAAFYSISRGLAKSGDPLGGTKPGETTTEFWLNIVTQVGNVAAASAGAVDPQTAAILMMVSNGAYGLSRGLAKGGAQPAE